MAKKVNYYSWIHELNKSALMTKYMSEADLYRNSLNGFQISQNMRSNANQFIDTARGRNNAGIMQRHTLNEANRGPSRGVGNYLPGQIERPYRQLTPQETAAAGLGSLMKDMGIMTPERAISMAPTLFDAGRHIAERPGTVFPDNPVDDIGEIGKAPASEIKKEIATASAARMRAATAAANAARSMGPVNAQPAGNSQAVENDANDWEMADPIDHPPPQFPSPEAANLEVARLNAERLGTSDEAARNAFKRKQMVDVAKQAMLAAQKAGKNAVQQREAGRSALRDYQGLRQQELSAEPPESVVEVEGGMLPVGEMETIARILRGSR